MTVALIKITVVLFYLNIFPSSRFRIASWALIGFLALSAVVTSLIGSFTCTPVQFFWNRDIKNGSCYDQLVANGVGGCLGVVQDIWLIALPAFQIRKLQMKKSQKAFVMALFALGGL